jgi:hypothetical protein
MNSTVPGTKPKRPNQRNFYTRELLIQLIFWFFWMVVLEGAFRKWLFPSLEKVIYFGKDFIALSIYWVAFKMSILPRRSYFYTSIMALAVIFLPLIGLQVIFTHISPICCAYGWRMYFYLIPLAFIMGEQMRGEDLAKLAKQISISTIPMAILVYVQIRSAPTAWVNRLHNGEENVTTIDWHVVRPMATFSHSMMLPVFLGIAISFILSLWMVPKLQRPVGPRMLMAATAATLLMIAFNGNRQLFFYVFFNVALAVVATFLSSSKKQKTRSLLALGAVIFGSVIMLSTVFAEGMNLMNERQRSAEAAEGSVFARAINTVTESAQALESGSLLGQGVGLGSGGGSLLATGSKGYTVGETEWMRVINESGLMGIVFIIWRVLMTFWIAWQSILAVKRTGNPLPLVLCGVTMPLLFQGVLTLVGTMNALGWFSVGLNMAAINIGKPPIIPEKPTLGLIKPSSEAA